MGEDSMLAVRSSLSKQELASLPEVERLRQVRQFAKYASAAMLFRVGLSDTTSARRQLLREAEESTMTSEKGQGTGENQGEEGFQGCVSCVKFVNPIIPVVFHLQERVARTQ